MYNREGNSYARISLATPFLEVPRSQLAGLFQQMDVLRPMGDGSLGAMGDYASVGEITANCSTVDSMPSITINIGSGFESIYYTIPAKEYVFRKVGFR